MKSSMKNLSLKDFTLLLSTKILCTYLRGIEILFKMMLENCNVF